ncbi:MAG: signal peptidase II [Planctomycetes bacterium]|nr:signal peptidase II [Planctomycetota bacterium]
MDSTAKGWPLFLVVTAAAAAGDLASKSWVFGVQGMPGESAAIPIVPPLLAVETNLNEGALFGMGQGMGAVFATVSVAAILGILALVARPSTRADRWVLTALGLIVGGIIGNLFDRLGLAGLRWHAPAERIGKPVLAVRDWIHFEIPGVLDWPIFNLADSWLVIGAAMLLYSSFAYREPVDTEPLVRP